MMDNEKFYLPNIYPEDTKLISDSENIGSGADIHDIRQELGMYRARIKDYNRVNDGRTYNMIVKSERYLRGLVAEARMDRAKVIGRAYYFTK